MPSEKKIKVNITSEFLAQCDFLCKKEPNKEWSGILFYNMEGDIDDVSKILITPVYIHLMDIGSSGATEFDWDKTFVELCIAKPELDKIDNPNIKYGHCHSHNSMGKLFV